MSKASNAGTLRGFCFLSFLVLTGCSRGCGARWLADKGVGEEGRAKKASPFLGGGTDCPAGLARCSEGAVEVSRAGFVEPTCKAGEKGCACPWERVDECRMGCESDDLVVDLPRETAAKQLCKAAESAFSTIQGGSTTRCELFGYTCSDGVVTRCGAGGEGRIVGRCHRACVQVSNPVEDLVEESAALGVLCERL